MRDKNIIHFIAIIVALAIISPAGRASVGQDNKGDSPKQSAPEKKEDCGCEATNTPADIVAIVGGVKVSIKDIDEPLRQRIDAMQNQVVEARNRELYLLVNSKLLEAEAKKNNLSPSKLIEREVVAKVKEPTDAEAQAFFDENKARIPGQFKEYKDRVIAYLRNQRQQEEAKKLADRLRAAADVKMLVERAEAPEKEADRAKVLATVNGEKITSADVEESLKPLIFRVQEEVYRLRKNEMELKLNDLLLEQESQKRKITARALIEAEVTPKVKKITEEDAKKFYDENKERINGDFAQIKSEAVNYLQQLEQRKAERAFAEQLRKRTALEIYLKEPEPPVLQIATGDQPSKGDDKAAVTIIEFTDFECPSCRATHPLLERLVEEYAGKVRLVVRDYPLDQHKNAFKAAQAAEAAREQGKYWEYAAALFENQKDLGVEKLKEYASSIGLDRKRFDEALDSNRHADKVEQDLQEGLRIGVGATPTIFINGRRVADRTYESLKMAVEESLKNQAKK